MTTISAEAATRREQARNDDGRFGPSAAPETDPGQVDLAGAPASPTTGDHHRREEEQLQAMEVSLLAQLKDVRTARMQHQIADWLRETEQAGVLGGQRPTALALIRHEEEVNEFGSADLTAGWCVDADGNTIDDEGSLPELTIQQHGDGWGPDLYADGWVDDNDQVDLDKVREWSASRTSHDTASNARFAARTALRRDSEMEMAGDLVTQVREHYPDARYVLLHPSGSGMSWSEIQGVDGTVLHEMYGEAGEGVPQAFDDQVDETVRGMTADAIGAPDGSWPEMCADPLEFDDYGQVEFETRLDLDLAAAKTGGRA